MPIVGDEYRQAVSDDPADRALEWYRNSKQYPDNPNFGVWGRINRAFQDGYAAGTSDHTTYITNTTALDGELNRLRMEADLRQEAYDKIFDQCRLLKRALRFLAEESHWSVSDGVPIVDESVPWEYAVSVLAEAESGPKDSE